MPVSKNTKWRLWAISAPRWGSSTSGKSVTSYPPPFRTARRWRLASGGRPPPYHGDCAAARRAVRAGRDNQTQCLGDRHTWLRLLNLWRIGMVELADCFRRRNRVWHCSSKINYRRQFVSRACSSYCLQELQGTTTNKKTSKADTS